MSHSFADVSFRCFSQDEVWGVCFLLAVLRMFQIKHELIVALVPLIYGCLRNDMKSVGGKSLNLNPGAAEGAF